MADPDQPQFDAHDGEAENRRITGNDGECGDEGQDADLESLAAHNRTSDNPESLIMTEPPRSFEPSKKTNPAASTGKKKAPPSDLSIERRLDHALKETFPASDPFSINPGAD